MQILAVDLPRIRHPIPPKKEPKNSFEHFGSFVFYARAGRSISFLCGGGNRYSLTLVVVVSSISTGATVLSASKGIVCGAVDGEVVAYISSFSASASSSSS